MWVCDTLESGVSLRMSCMLLCWKFDVSYLIVIKKIQLIIDMPTMIRTTFLHVEFEFGDGVSTAWSNFSQVICFDRTTLFRVCID
jgi:hypothetical protein